MGGAVGRHLLEHPSRVIPTALVQLKWGKAGQNMIEHVNNIAKGVVYIITKKMGVML